jgi:diguanylate cyclase (GGDEF)-like protein
MLSSSLKKMGHDVISVSDGTEAIETLSSTDGPHLAILDWKTPGLDVPYFCREIRERFGPLVYIILLISSGTADDVLLLDSGPDDFLLKPFTELELRGRLRSGSRVLGLTEQLATQRTLLKAATCDDVTGLWNRRMILDQLARELNRMKHEQKSLAVAMADIDMFKQVNDTYGHAAGDSVLRDIAAALRLPLRSYDFIGRYGGEEFLVLLPGCDTRAGAEIARRLCVTVASTPMLICDVEVPMTVSIGLSSTADIGFDPAMLIAAADAAMYRAKLSGRNSVETNTTP